MSIIGKIGDLLGTREEKILGVALIIALLLPHTNTFLLLVNPLICMMLMIFSSHKVNHYILFPIVAILLSVVINITGDAGGKSILTAISLIFFLFAFPLVTNVKVKDTYIYISFVLIFLSQIGYMFHLGFVTSFVDTYYPITWGEASIMNMINGVSIDNYSDYRLGGLYRNPNHCAKYVSFLLAIFLVNNGSKSIRKQVLFIVFSFISILLTGSRTGFVVASALVLFALSRKRNKKTSHLMRNIAVASSFVVLLYIVLHTGGDTRGLSIEEGLKDSAGAKFALTLRYLADENSLIYLIFGHLDLTLFKSPYTYSLDCEYGYIIYCFGFLGLIAFGYTLWKFYKHINKQDRFFFLILLWMVSSSIFMAYRSSFVFLLLLSSIYPSKLDSFAKKVMK